MVSKSTLANKVLNSWSSVGKLGSWEVGKLGSWEVGQRLRKLLSISGALFVT